MEKICLIVPCYNEAGRFKVEGVAALDHLTFIFVNDGSRDSTLEILNKSKRPQDHVLDLSSNVGKGEAVRQGVQFALKLPEFDSFEWVGFWDADFATPLAEIPGFLSYARLFSRADSIWGSRIYKYGSTITRSFKRHIFSRLFATAAGQLLDLPTYDSQCGSKLFRPSVLPLAFGEPFISRWIFDVELCFRLKDHFVIEYPLTSWTDVSGGSIRVFRLISRTFGDLLRIRKRYYRPGIWQQTAQSAKRHSR